MILQVLNIRKELSDYTGIIIGATKYFDVETMKKVYEQGITHFGENRVQSFLSKKDMLQDYPITWHFIGTLQRKKVKKIINEIDYLHSLDHLSLAEEINKRRKTPLPCFIQVNISNEDSKHGLQPDQVIPFIEQLRELKQIKLIGLMGMASHTDDEELIHSQFQILNDLQQNIKETTSLSLPELSIGMSNDYHIAIKHNATFLRLGSVLFKKEV